MGQQIRKKEIRRRRKRREKQIKQRKMERMAGLVRSSSSSIPAGSGPAGASS